MAWPAGPTRTKGQSLFDQAANTGTEHNSISHQQYQPAQAMKGEVSAVDHALKIEQPTGPRWIDDADFLWRAVTKQDTCPQHQINRQSDEGRQVDLQATGSLPSSESAATWALALANAV